MRWMPHAWLGVAVLLLRLRGDAVVVFRACWRYFVVGVFACVHDSHGLAVFGVGVVSLPCGRPPSVVQQALITHLYFSYCTHVCMYVTLLRWTRGMRLVVVLLAQTLETHFLIFFFLSKNTSAVHTDVYPSSLRIIGSGGLLLLHTSQPFPIPFPLTLLNFLLPYV